MADDLPVFKAALAGGTGITDKEKEAEFHRAYVRAFTHWQFVERELLFVFFYLTNARQPGVISAIWKTDINFWTRLGMIDAAAQFTGRIG